MLPRQIVFRGEFVLTDFELASSGVCTLVCTMSQRFVLGAAGGMVLGLYVWHVASRRRRRRTTAPSADTARCSTAPITLRPTRAGAATRRRVKLVLEYDGSAFCGWQTQEARRRDGAVSTRGSSPAMRAVQDAVEAAVLALSTTADPSDQRPPTVVANGPRRACDGPGRGRVDLHGAQ